MNLEQNVQPTDFEILGILSVEDLKAQQRVRHMVEEEIFQNSILDAYGYFDGIDGWLRRSILTQEWTLRLPRFSDKIELPAPPLDSVISIKYFDVDDTEQTLATSVYSVHKHTTYGYIARKNAQSWPATTVRDDAVAIHYRAGYGDANAVKAKAPGIRRALILLAGHYYRNREQTFAEPRLVEVPRDLLHGMDRSAGKFRLPAHHVDLAGHCS